MRITYLANVRLPTERAYGIQIINMCRAFSLAGIDVSLFFPYRISRAIRQNIFEYYSVEETFKAKRLWALDFYLPSFLNKFAFHLKNFFSAVSLAWCAFFAKSDFVYSRDELPIFLLSFLRNNLCFEAHTFSDARRFYYRRFKNKKVRIIVISDSLRQVFIREGFDPVNIMVAPDAVDLEVFGKQLSKTESRVGVGLPLTGDIVMYSGHLFEKKGAITLAESARYLPDTFFVFIGGTERGINQFNKKYSSRKNIIIVGHKPHKDIPRYLQAADVLVLPNSGEESVSDKFTSPLKLFEYMASRRVIIASDLPVLREVLNESNSVLVAPDSPDILFKNIKYVLSNPELQDKLSNQAYEDVSGKTWNRRAVNIANFLSQFV
ncbi:MAG: glycosyltransferase family 4 protein [Candidatus Pacebacteria bacterium]|nr:glycosyltransferase family 4 protein [Candidatus Paceibacterota bacterium]